MTFGLETALPTYHPVEILRGVGLWGEWKAHISQQEERRHGVCKDLILKQPTPNSHLHTCWGISTNSTASVSKKSDLGPPVCALGFPAPAGHWGLSRVLIWCCWWFPYDFDELVHLSSYLSHGKAKSVEGTSSPHSFWSLRSKLEHSGMNSEPRSTHFKKRPVPLVHLPNKQSHPSRDLLYRTPTPFSLPKAMRYSRNLYEVCPEGVQPCNMKNRDIY